MPHLSNFIPKAYYNGRLRRPLGNLERLYYEDNKNLPGMVLLSCKKNLEPCHVKDALNILVSRHPMMRMSVRNRNGVLQFIEMYNVPVDVNIINSNDWDSLLDHELRPYDQNGPLWRFVWLQSKFNTDNHLFQFLLSVHHCISDFPYSYLIIMEFLDILKSLQNGSDIVKIEHLFPLPIEEIVTPNANMSNTHPVLKEDTVISALKAYEHYYIKEIIFLGNKTRIPGISVWRALDNETSECFPTTCKSKSVTNTSAILAASIISFCNLLHRKGCRDIVRLEYSFATNLRRYMENSEPFFPGLAVVVCPVSLDVDVGATSSLGKNFWRLANTITKQLLQTVVNDRKPVDVLHNDIANALKYDRKKGKTEIVFRLSNVESVNRLEIENNKNCQLLDFQFKDDVEVDHCVIFQVLSH